MVDIFNNIEPKSYIRNDIPDDVANGKRKFGFIAQEVKAQITRKADFQSLVMTSTLGKNDDDETDKEINIVNTVPSPTPEVDNTVPVPVPTPTPEVNNTVPVPAPAPTPEVVNTVPSPEVVNTLEVKSGGSIGGSDIDTSNNGGEYSNDDEINNNDTNDRTIANTTETTTHEIKHKKKNRRKKKNNVPVI